MEVRTTKSGNAPTESGNAPNETVSSVNLLTGIRGSDLVLPKLRVDPFVALSPKPGERGARLRRLLLRTDALVVLLAIALVDLMRWSAWGDSTPIGHLLAFAVVSTPVWLVLAHASGLYHAGGYRVEHDTAEEAAPIIRVTTMWAWSMVIAILVTQGSVSWIEQLVLLWGVVCVLSIVGRSVARAYGRRQAWYLQNALVLGTSSQAASVVRKILRHPESGVNVVAVVDLDAEDDAVRRIADFSFIPVIGSLASIGDLVVKHEIHRVIIGSSPSTGDRDELLDSLAAEGVQIDIIPTPFQALGARVDVHHLEGAPLMTLPRARLTRSARFLKRAFDIAVSAVALVMLLPLLAGVAIAIKLDSRGPLFFRQTRVGRDGHRFTLWKLRSMHRDADARKSDFAELNLHGPTPGEGMFKIRDDPRITRVGRVIRRYSLDELPQLYNVLIGDMSLVGPRPLIEEEAGQVEGRFRHRLALTPGITGLWQVYGRSDIPFSEMVSLDYLYVTNWTLWGDMKLLMKTLPAVAHGNGAY
jgi:exopolysaccharide biosynthesis polyprenyl glycosylphosphotransferase